MEPMKLSILSVRRDGSKVVANARADCEEAQIHLRLTFHVEGDVTAAELWTRSYDEALRYLDIA